jgi:hypothetical protein
MTMMMEIYHRSIVVGVVADNGGFKAKTEAIAIGGQKLIFPGSQKAFFIFDLPCT